jgi:hypothetical protein
MARHKEVVKALVSRFGHPLPKTHSWSSEDRKVLMVALVHSADLSAPSRPADMAGMWARAVCEEFFQQSEREVNLDLDLAAPSPKRDDSIIWKSQVTDSY